MEKYLESLSDGSLKDLYKAFRVKNISSLQKKLEDKNLVLSKMFSLSFEYRTVVLFIISEFYDKRPFAIDIAYKMNYQQKQLPIFFNLLDKIKEVGFVYYQKKRMRLNANDDIIFFLPEIKNIIKDYIIKDESDISEENVKYRDEKFTNKVFEKYEEFIVYLNNLGGVIEHNKEKFESIEVSDEAILELLNANIINTYYLLGSENKQLLSKLFICLDNIKVIDTIKKNIYKKIDNTTFIYNHLNLLTDIDTIINKIELENIKFSSDNKTLDIKLLSDYLSLNELCNICIKLELLENTNKNNIVINSKAVNEFLECSTSKRIDILLNSMFLENKELYRYVASLINYSTKDLSVNDILKEVKQKEYVANFDLISKMLYQMFLLGLIEIAFYEKSIVAVRKKEYAKDGRCIINGNYELTLINHKSFESEFIYMISIYFELEKQDNVYFYKITEESILRGKALECQKPKYKFDKMISSLESVLNKDNLSIPKHIETSIRRWYERVIKMSLFENTTLIKIEGIDKLEEVIFDAEKKEIFIKPISNNYAIIETTKSRKAVAKFFRHKKIIISL